MIVDCALYRDGRRTRTPDDLSAALARARGQGDSFLWIGVHDPTEPEFADIAAALELHPLAVEDVVKAHQRPKLEIYPGALFGLGEHRYSGWR